MSEIAALLQVMARLRDPEHGCPWDREQTYASVVPHTLEEAYEVADAIERGDLGHLREELGDLLFQVVFYAQIASEQGLFDFADVARGITDKMIRRHPHVFGDARFRDRAEHSAAWEQIKAEEGGGRPPRVLSGVPLALPALTRALKLQKKAARVGFDWGSLGPVLDKIDEELREIRAEVECNATPERLADELGDVLFAVANLARHLGVDPEAALRGTNAKFERRFAHVEDRLAAAGQLPEQAGLAAMDALWDEAKRRGL